MAKLDRQTAIDLDTCIHCGMCAEACLFFTETGAPERTPINKTEPLRRVWKQEYTLLGRIGKIFGLGKKVTDEMMAEFWAPLRTPEGRKGFLRLAKSLDNSHIGAKCFMLLNHFVMPSALFPWTGD